MERMRRVAAANFDSGTEAAAEHLLFNCFNP
jgi:hypothetical protein